MKQYVGYWKQSIYYCFRTMCLKPNRRRVLYGIEFTAQQSQLIEEITTALDQFKDSDEYDGSNFDSEFDSNSDVDFDFDSSSDDDEEDDDRPGMTRTFEVNRLVDENTIDSSLHVEICMYSSYEDIFI